MPEYGYKYSYKYSHKYSYKYSYTWFISTMNLQAGFKALAHLEVHGTD